MKTRVEDCVAVWLTVVEYGCIGACVVPVVWCGGWCGCISVSVWMVRQCGGGGGGLGVCVFSLLVCSLPYHLDPGKCSVLCISVT